MVHPQVPVISRVAAAASGVLLGFGTRYGLMRYWWVVAKIAINLAVIITDAALVRRAAHRLAVTGSGASDLYGVTIAHVIVLGVATVLSVWKPKARTARGRRVVEAKEHSSMATAAVRRAA